MAGDDAGVIAPAKINLALHVCGKRADGYHLLDSLVAFADVGDRIRVDAAPALALSVTGPFAKDLANEPDNLVLRAARLLAAKAGVAPQAKIVLEKNLPVASGIGGGSADAAAALIACARLWGVDVSILTIADVTGLGADVPVCLKGKAALMRGIGEDLTPAVLPPAWVVLANPRRPLSTKDVFGALKERFGAPMPPLPPLPDGRALAGYLGRQRNDLGPPAMELMPEIGAVLNALEGLAGCQLARLSGSGPTCFGLFASAAEARNGAEMLQKAHPPWWIAPAALAEPGR